MTHARIDVAPDSTFGGGDDFFINLAIPWADMELVDIFPDTPVFIWAGTSSVNNALDLDIACHTGSGGPVSLDGSASDIHVSDPVLDSDGDGFTDDQEVAAGSDPDDPASTPSGGATGEVILEGGGGCAVAGHMRGTPWLPALVGALLCGLVRRRRRRSGSDSR
jgi:hypothetical protein